MSVEHIYIEELDSISHLLPESEYLRACRFVHMSFKAREFKKNCMTREARRTHRMYTRQLTIQLRIIRSIAK